MALVDAISERKSRHIRLTCGVHYMVRRKVRYGSVHILCRWENTYLRSRK